MSPCDLCMQEIRLRYMLLLIERATLNRNANKFCPHPSLPALCIIHFVHIIQAKCNILSEC